MKVRIINKSHHPLPGYATPLSAGMDIRANLSESVVLKPLERKLIPTGLYISLPEGYEAQMRPRSGLALKHGITVNDGERICQMVIAAHSHVDWEPVETLDDTERGAGGFGHTGKE